MLWTLTLAIRSKAIPKDKKQTHISLALSLADDKAYSDIGSMGRSMQIPTKVLTALDIDLCHRPRYDPINLKAMP
ncbi:hypothetical protein M0802_016589 [Mischocyttarus mexicanus]|nr:hypothetical protein M0802_016589 [Mischocyttarus mexicanus]